MTDSPASVSKPAPWRRAVLGVAFAAAAVVVGVVAVETWLFLTADAPAEVSLDDAVESVADGAVASAADGAADSSRSTAVGVDPASVVAADDGAEAPVDGRSAEADADAAGTDDTTAGVGSTETPPGTDLSGTWFVDATAGASDQTGATASFVGFRVDEELRGIGATTAVGRTGDIVGSITLDGTKLVDAVFEIDLTTLTTDNSNRDDSVHGALETWEYPTGSFVLTEPIELGPGAVEGQPVAVGAVGDFTVHGVTRPTRFDLDAQWIDDTIVVVGSTEITFADFGVEVPGGEPVISVAEVGTVELQLLFTR